jgi:serine phosphatase RsbU (regulator of sigma subunit)
MQSSQEIVNAVVGSVNRFRSGVNPEDDMTLVVIKVTG